MNRRLPRLNPAGAPHAHKGLILDKFVPVKEGTKDESNFEALAAIARRDSAYPAYKLAYQRWTGWMDARENAVRLQGAVKGRMAIGLGMKGTTEIGCRLHHTYGVPVIPGSSLRGALRAALEASSKKEAEIWKQRADFLFGTQDSAGFARVYDAWWIPEDGRSGLSVDVITTHHQQYYTGNQGAAHTDFDSPIPVHYLTVTGKFYFAIDAPNDSWSKFLEKLLRQALETNGIGAKRAAGYGRFDGWRTP